MARSKYKRAHSLFSKIGAWLLCSSLIAGFAIAGGGAPAAQKTAVVLGTGTVGGGFPLYGAAFADTINAIDHSLSVEPRATRGSTENVALLEAGQLDTGQVTGEVAYEALQGIGRAPTDLRILSAMYPNSGLFIVRADSPYRSLADLKGKAIVWGARASGFVVLARYALDALGLDMNRDFQPIYLDQAADGPAMVLDGRAAALWGGGVGWPSFVTIAKSPAGARFIAPSRTDVERIAAKYPFIKPVTLPAGSYPGQTAPVATIGAWVLMLARPDLPDDVAYRLARALHHAAPELGARLAQARASTLANTVAAAPSLELIHPGVLRYLREIGLVRAEDAKE